MSVYVLKEKQKKRSIAIIPVPDWVRIPERECGGWNVVEYVEASVVAECTMITVRTTMRFKKNQLPVQ